ncbi:MAG: DUF4157 domain-containing protein [Deltaproteobacteria bacterium]|nr:DUF4157 domain-containing protein [Deltaproteobacteria bacterium]
MNPEDLLQFFIENGIRWVESQRDAHRSCARDLTKTEKFTLAPFFDTNILNLAKIKMVPVIENPGFYSELEDMEIPGILDFSFAAGITFKDTIVVSQRYLRHRSPTTALIFHELVHVVQYQLLHVQEFIERYIAGWAENGFDYSAIPLEAEAYRLGHRFEKNPGQTFSVIAEVRRSLGVKVQST